MEHPHDAAVKAAASPCGPSGPLGGLATSVALGGLSGLAGHGLHYAAALGAGLATGAAAPANIALSGVFLLASYGGWHFGLGGRHRPARERATAFAVQAGLSVAVALGVQHVVGHDHLRGERAEWYRSLPPELRDSMMEGATRTYRTLPPSLRARLDQESKANGLSPVVYLLTCSGNDPLSAEIVRFQAERGRRDPDRNPNPNP